MGEDDIEWLKERVNNLERRVSYLEAELEMSAEKQQFRNMVDRVFSKGEITDIDMDDSLEWTASAEVPAEYVKYIGEKISEKERCEWFTESVSDGSVVMILEKRVH